MTDNMADKPPGTEFGKRRPPPPPQPPTVSPKRSRHVVLLVMGTFAVGGGAYALMAPENCQPPPAPSVAAPAQPEAQTGCPSHGSSSSHSGYSRSSRFSFFGGGDSSSHSSSSGAAETGGVSRGGFGSFAHAFGFGGG